VDWSQCVLPCGSSCCPLVCMQPFLVVYMHIHQTHAHMKFTDRAKTQYMGRVIERNTTLCACRYPLDSHTTVLPIHYTPTSLTRRPNARATAHETGHGLRLLCPHTGYAVYYAPSQTNAREGRWSDQDFILDERLRPGSSSATSTTRAHPSHTMS